MSKLLVTCNKLILSIILVFLLLISWGESSSVTILKKDVPQQFDFIPLRYGSRSANIYEDYPLEVAGKDFSMVGLMTRFIYGYTLGPVVNAMSGFYSTFLSPVLDPIIQLAMLPITLTLKPVKFIGGAMLSPLGPMYHKAMQSAGFETKKPDKDKSSAEKEQEKTQSRRRRGLMDTTTRLTSNIMELPFNAVELPFDILRIVFGVLFSPFRLMSAVMRSPFGDNQSNIQKLNTNSNSPLGNIDVNDMFNKLTTKFVESINDSSRKMLLNVMMKLWKFLKKTGLPQLDKTLQKYAKSSVLSDDMKSWISTFHSTYSMAHLLGFL